MKINYWIKRLLVYFVISIIYLQIICCQKRIVKYNQGLPQAINLANLNSNYDDYNPGIVVIPDWSDHLLMFASNRNSAGNNFDIILYKIRIHTVEKNILAIRAIQRQKMNPFKYINTTIDELGPFFIYNNDKYNYDETDNTAYEIFYTRRDTSGTETCMFAKTKNGESAFHPIIHLKTLGYEKYPIEILYKKKKVSSGYLMVLDTTYTRMHNFYMQATVNHKSNIFSASGNQDTSRLDVSLVSVSDTNYNDKCPLVINNYNGENAYIMLFASDRPGGYGGYDLYYSFKKFKYLNEEDMGVYEEWSVPKNLGKEINSGYNDFRPALLYNGLSSYLIFSSDRPGGKGGYDLYFKLIDLNSLIPRF